MSNLSKEEQEAIDILENQIADYVIGDFCVGKYCPQEDACKNDDCPFEKAIDIVVNLIDKQQKEIEELDKKFRYVVPDEMISLNYVSKDKIREKIKEYEQYIDELHPASDCMVIDMYEDYIKAWKKLIGDEDE